MKNLSIAYCWHYADGLEYVCRYKDKVMYANNYMVLHYVNANQHIQHMQFALHSNTCKFVYFSGPS